MMKTHALFGALVLIGLVSQASAADVKLSYPTKRAVYQTNELIDLAVRRADTKALPASTMTVSLEPDGGAGPGTMRFTFAVPAANGNERTEHLHLNASMLRPGKYNVSVESDGGKASVPLEIFSHVRRSDYR